MRREFDDMASHIDLTSSTPTSHKFVKAGSIQEQVRDILDERPKDLKLVCVDGCILIHRLVLTGLSPFLVNLLSGMNPKKTPCLTLDDVKLRHLRKVVILLYHGQIVVDDEEKEKVCEILNMLQFPVGELFSRKATKKDLSQQEVVLSEVDVKESGFDECEEGKPNNFASTSYDSSQLSTRKRHFELISLDDGMKTNATQVDDLAANPTKSLCRMDISQSDSNIQLGGGGSASGNLCDIDTRGSQTTECIKEELGFLEEGALWNEQVEMEVDCPVFDGKYEGGANSTIIDPTKGSDFSLEMNPTSPARRGDGETDRRDHAKATSSSQSDFLSDQRTSEYNPVELNEVDHFLISAGNFDADYNRARELEAKVPITGPAPVDIDVRKIRTAVYAENMLKGPRFNLVKKDDGSCAIHSAIRRKNQKLVTFLIENGICTLDETDGNGNTPLHIAMEQQLNASISYFMEGGASLYAANNEGCTPLCIALENISEDTRDILLQMEERGLQMEDYARDALMLVFNEYCRLEPLRWIDIHSRGVLSVIRYFSEKGGVLQFDYHMPSLLRLVKNIDLDDEDFQLKAEEIMKMSQFSTEKNFASRLKEDKITLEKLLLCLLESKQLVAVVKFVQEYIFKKKQKYSNGYPGVREALDFDSRGVVLIRALDKDICLSRVMDTMMSVKCCVDNQIPNNTARDELYVLQVGKFTADILRRLRREAGKFIVVADSVASDLEEQCTVIEDTIEWNDLTWEARLEFGSPGDYSGFRFGEESWSLFYQCLRDLSPRKITGEDCYTFFRFLNGRDLINLMKRKTTLSDIMGKLFDECVEVLTEDEIKILENIAVKETFKFRPTSISQSENLGIMEDLVTKKWLVKEDEDFKFRNKISSSYFLALRILRLPQKLSLDKTKYLFESKKKQFKPMRKLSMEEAQVFTNDSFVFFIDRLFKKVEQCALALTIDKDFMTSFMEACAASNAHNFLKLLSHQKRIKCDSSNIIHLLACGSVQLPKQRIMERKQLIQKLISNGNNSHMEGVRLNNWKVNDPSNNFLPEEMPFTHVEIIKMLIDLDSECGYEPDEITFAHMASYYMPLDQFDELVQYLVGKGLASKFFSVSCQHHKNPMERAEEYFKQRPSLKTRLISAGVELNDDPMFYVGKKGDDIRDESLITPFEYYKV